MGVQIDGFELYFKLVLMEWNELTHKIVQILLHFPSVSFPETKQSTICYLKF